MNLFKEMAIDVLSVLFSNLSVSRNSRQYCAHPCACRVLCRLVRDQRLVCHYFYARFYKCARMCAQIVVRRNSRQYYAHPYRTRRSVGHDFCARFYKCARMCAQIFVCVWKIFSPDLPSFPEWRGSMQSASMRKEFPGI